MNKVKGVVVTFSEDIHEPEAKAIMAAIRLIGHVVAVQPLTADAGDLVNRMQIRHDFRRRIWRALEEDE